MLAWREGCAAETAPPRFVAVIRGGGVSPPQQASYLFILLINHFPIDLVIQLVTLDFQPLVFRLSLFPFACFGDR